MKYISLKTNKGKYRVPLKIIATNRTEYYSTVDGYEKNSDGWKSEMDYVVNDSYEGIDWMGNNMDLEDIKPFMEKIVDETEDEEWDYESFEIVNF